MRASPHLVFLLFGSRRNFYYWVRVCLCVAFMTAGIPCFGQTFDGVVFNFESGEDGWEAMEGGSRSVSKLHNKTYPETTAQSLRWDWVAGSHLRVSDKAMAEKMDAVDTHHMILSVYSDVASPQAYLEFRVGDETEIPAGQSKYRFKFYLNFKGWRTVHLKNMLETVPNANWAGSDDFEAMYIYAPDSGSGTVYFDEVEFLTTFAGGKMDCGWQVPYELADPSNPLDDRFSGLGSTWGLTYRWSLVPEWPTPPGLITQKQVNAFEQIEDQYERFLLGPFAESNDVKSAIDNADNLRADPETPQSAEVATQTRRGRTPELSPRLQSIYDDFITYLSQNDARFSEFHVVQGEKSITGRALVFGGRMNQSEQFLERAVDILLRFVWEYRLTGDSKAKDKALLMLDYIHDQGYGWGNSWGTLDHLQNHVGSYNAAVFLIRNELSLQQRADVIDALKWYSEFGECYQQEYYRKGNTADKLGCNETARMIYVLMQPNSPEKVRDMDAFRRWLINAYSPSGGWVGCVKPDYTIYHHYGPQGKSYGPTGIIGTSTVIYSMRNNIFAVPDEAVAQIEQVMTNWGRYYNKYACHSGVQGAGPWLDKNNGDKIANATPALAMVAASRANPSDSRLSGLFKYWYEPYPSSLAEDLKPVGKVGRYVRRTIGAVELMEDLASDPRVVGSHPESGHWNYSWACMGVHRREQWMASVCGWNMTAVNYEAEAERWYSRHGSIFAVNNGDGMIPNGWNTAAGWDHCRYPGATALIVDRDELPKKGRYWHRDGMVGGGHLNQRDGVFAFNLTPRISGLDTKPDVDVGHDLWAKKSCFFFDDTIICVGSDIKLERNGDRPVQTTLFQSWLQDQASKYPIYANSTNEIADFPYRHSVSSGSHWLVDPYGIGYHISDLDRGLEIRRQQQSATNRKSDVESGEFAVAWLNHGKLPVDAGYAYAMRMNATPQSMERFAANVPYQVLKSDSEAHIVSYTDSRHGYVFWESQDKVAHGVVTSIDDPCVVLTEQLADGHMQLSLTDPDLHLPFDFDADMREDHNIQLLGEMNTIQLTLRGVWKIASSDQGVRILSTDENQTVIEFECLNGKSLNADFVGASHDELNTDAQSRQLRISPTRTSFDLGRE